jgi:hypothetical protein
VSAELWQLLGMERALIPLLEHPAFIGLAPAAAFWLIRLVNSPIWSEERRVMEWAALAPCSVVRLTAIRGLAERALGARVGIERPTDPATVTRSRCCTRATSIAVRCAGWSPRMSPATASGGFAIPLTVAWFARHPKLDRIAWLGGFETRGAIDGIGEVTLAVETDLLEALKLGTYVGTCFGRGGNFAYSAAAVVLDVNKHVVYARDARGAVIGRQLIAISDVDRLVCYPIYGSASEAQLAPVFRAFDQAFAAKLGVPIYRPSHDNDDDDDDDGHDHGGWQVACVLSRDCYFDLMWDPGADSVAVATPDDRSR